jgi:hypothetical protein
VPTGAAKAVGAIALTEIAVAMPSAAIFFTKAFLMDV